eukprot:jgi/Bigna1/144752/aug1.91_g19460
MVRYRSGRKIGQDIRLNIFEPNSLKGMRCLDIGCNEGILTLGLALKAQPYASESISTTNNQQQQQQHLEKRAFSTKRGKRK